MFITYHYISRMIIMIIPYMDQMSMIMIIFATLILSYLSMHVYVPIVYAYLIELAFYGRLLLIQLNYRSKNYHTFILVVVNRPLISCL